MLDWIGISLLRPSIYGHLGVDVFGDCGFWVVYA
jgi:hypothetical protein